MNTLRKILGILVVLWVVVPTGTFAARLYPVTENTTITSDHQFLVEVNVDTEESINTIAGHLQFPKELFRVMNIFDGDSIITFWIDKPKIGAPGMISFSGITPGGFAGENHKIFSVVLEAIKPGQGNLGFTDVTTLANDGLGTQVPIKIGILPISVLPSDGTSQDKTMNDQDPPEPFTVVVESDPNIWNGKHFLVFSAQDKGAGISHYEIREGKQGVFKPGESPYLLEDQSLLKTISVKAIDKAGNERTTTIEKGDLIKNIWEEFRGSAIIGIGILLLLILLFIAKRSWLNPGK